MHYHVHHNKILSDLAHSEIQNFIAFAFNIFDFIARRLYIHNENLQMVEKLVIPKHAMETEGGYFWLENNIVHICNKPTNNLTLKVALLNIEMSRQIAAGISRPILIDMTDVKSMERAAREAYAAAGIPKYVTAVALVTRSALSRVVGNFFIGFNRAEVPTRLFNDYSTAFAWLKKIAS